MFRVKICGITSVDDAQAAVRAGADAIGLNFCAASPRAVQLDVARQIAAALPAHVCRVGVFVNAAVDEVRHVAREVPLDLVQLHGDEPPEALRALCPLPLLRAVRMAGDLSAVGDYLARCHRLRAMPRMVLVDAARDGQFGGTGATLDWESLARHRTQLAGVPLVLAGGLTPENVAAAILQVRPWAVDVASGVETAPGRKAAARMAAFAAAARAAFARR